jgi:NAD(P)-dependent dehydrogenase (short-subunit alcohol dehydrogenase family)
MMSANPKIAVVTAGANGIGRAITEEFIQGGASVAVIDIDRAGLARLNEDFGERVFTYNGDVAEEGTLKAFADAVIGRFGRLDYLVNNACISKRGILSGCNYEDFTYVLRVGLIAAYYLTSLFLPHFSAGASIVNISSTRASMSQSDTESYSAAKGGISALTHALSVSLAGRVRVNSISPGWIDTGAYHEVLDYVPAYSEGDIRQHPAGRVGHPRDIAAMAAFLCSDKAGFIDGENIAIDGGMTKLMVYHADEGWELQTRPTPKQA